MHDDIGCDARISLRLSSNFCNSWPSCRIMINGNVIFDDTVKGEQLIQTDFVLRKDNNITIEHHSKAFGENGVWDTKLEDGIITADKNMHVHDLRIMGISLRDVWHKGRMVSTDGVEQLPQHAEALHFYKNATYRLDFAAPFYDWLIDFRRQGFKSVGPIWKLSSLNSQPDGYSSDMSELEPIIARIKSDIAGMP